MNNKMEFSEYLNLKYRQMLIIMGMSSVVLSIATAAFFLNDYLSLKKRIQTSLFSHAAFLSASTAPLLENKNRAQANRILQLADTDDQIVQVILYDADKKVFAGYVKPQAGVPEFELPAEPGIAFADTIATLLHPVESDGYVHGWLYIEYSLQSLRKTMNHYAAISLGIFIIGMAISWIMSNLSERLIVEPITRLAELVGKITRNKDYSERMQTERRDEIGVLIAGFNTMLDTIQEREKELKQHGDKLESLVELRTKQLHHRANYDALTKLPNRHLLMEKIYESIGRLQGSSKKIALMLIDIDRFKVINDSLGHHVGDELLQKIAHRLASILRKCDCVARPGGDEFVILLDNITSREEVELLAQKVMHEFTEPFELKNHRLHATASIGISLYPDDAEDGVGLLKRADISMYRSKSGGTNTFLFYDPSIDNSDERLLLENRLRNALDNKELYMVYQPQISLGDNRVCGFEALMRWNHPEMGKVYPMEFVPIAEEIGIISQLSKWAISTVCKQYGEWVRQGVHPIKVSVNISASDLLMVDFIQHVATAVRNSNMEPGCLELEITEDVFIAKADQIVDVLRRLRNLGVAIAIDDFGTGYSSLSYLQNFPIDLLKLDGSFIRNISNSEKSRGIVSSAISLAHGLGLKIVAECVDTEQQKDFLATQGCDIVQGFYFSEPVEAGEVPQYLAAVKPESYKFVS